MIENELTNELIVERNDGYSLIGSIMSDRNISLQTKGIYAYFYSFATNETNRFPSISKIISDLNISKGTFYKYIKPLIEYGYISVTQVKNGSHYGGNVYTLHDISKGDER